MIVVDALWLETDERRLGLYDKGVMKLDFQSWTKKTVKEDHRQEMD
jgi:hypothetical protein